MSSIRSSFDELSVMVACTRTRPCSHEVAEQDPDDPDRHGRERGDLGDRALVAQVEHPLRAGTQVGVGARVVRLDGAGWPPSGGRRQPSSARP